MCINYCINDDRGWSQTECWFLINKHTCACCAAARWDQVLQLLGCWDGLLESSISSSYICRRNISFIRPLKHSDWRASSAARSKSCRNSWTNKRRVGLPCWEIIWGRRNLDYEQALSLSRPALFSPLTWGKDIIERIGKRTRRIILDWSRRTYTTFATVRKVMDSHIGLALVRH